MQVEIGILATEFLRDFIKKAMGEIGVDCGYKIFTYNSFQNIPEIYAAMPDNIQGVVTSGDFPAHIIRRSFPDTNRVVIPFDTDDAGIYKLFLTLLNENRGLNLSRIYADFVGVFEIDLNEYLFGEQKQSLSGLVESGLSKMDMEEIIQIERTQVQKHLYLWREGQIDISITRFSSIVDELNMAGIKVYFPYPTFEYMKNVCQKIVQEIRIKKLREVQPAIINIALRSVKYADVPDVSFERQCIELHEALMKFKNHSLQDYLLRRSHFGFEIFTNRKIVAEITDIFQYCRLGDFLQDRLSFKVCIGYGIGTDIYQARINAVNATQESRLNSAGSSFIINEQEELIGPLCEGQNLVVPRETSSLIKKVAKCSGLSSLTVQKVIAVAGMMRGRQITSRELALKLSITQRSANRFLSALSSAKMAEVVWEKRNTTKGRPERVYRIKIEE